MFAWFHKREKINAPDGRYTFHIVPVPTPGTQELVFDREYQDPVYPLLGGAGTLTRMQLRVLQHPQVRQILVSPTYGPGGIPVPDQTLDFAGLEDNNG